MAWLAEVEAAAQPAAQAEEAPPEAEAEAQALAPERDWVPLQD
jgi:hypothetical protein